MISSQVGTGADFNAKRAPVLFLNARSLNAATVDPDQLVFMQVRACPDSYIEVIS